MSRNTIVVTGAFGGIGDAVCTMLARRGREVVRVGRRLPPRPEPPGGTGAIDVQADLTTAGGWEAVRSAASADRRTITGLVHCAGALVPGDFPNHSPADLRSMLDDNVLSLMLGFRALLPGMIRRGHGRLVVVGSLGGIVPMPHGAVYASTKFAVRGFVLSMAGELRGTGVAVSLLSCGPVDTRMLRREALERGPISFVNPPLPPAGVAEAVEELLAHPRDELIVPRSHALLTPIVGAYARLFRGLYPLAATLGRSRKRRYAAAPVSAGFVPGESR